MLRQESVTTAIRTMSLLLASGSGYILPSLLSLLLILYVTSLLPVLLLSAAMERKSRLWAIPMIIRERQTDGPLTARVRRVRELIHDVVLVVHVLLNGALEAVSGRPQKSHIRLT